MKKTALLTLMLLPVLTACNSYPFPKFGPLEPGEKYDIGILLPVEHPALDKAAQGFIQGLASKGWDTTNLNIVTKNAQGSSDDQRTFAKTLINECDLTLGVGTGASVDLKAAQKNKGSHNPILFTAVTDPVDAKLVKSLSSPGGYVTGTTDANPVEEQVSLVKMILPSADKVGIFFTQTESNSEAQAKQAKAAIQGAGMECVIKTCTSANDLQSTFAALLNTSGLDAIYIPTDNNVAANMAKIRTAMNGSGKLLIGGEENMVAGGAHITLSIDYTMLGVKTGEMAAQILNGEAKPKDLPVLGMTKDECTYVMNSSALSEAGVTLPQEVRDMCVEAE